MNFFSELKRRNVYKVAVAYVVAGWALAQGIAQVLPVFDVPNWIVRLLVLLIILGLPVALILAWTFEMTPEGIKRADALPIAPADVRPKKRTWIYVVIVGALFSAGLFLLGRYSAANRRSELPALPSKSIAVLPFENLSHDPDNAYFAEGIQEEILTRLAKISALKVISRTSTMRYASRPTNLREIAHELGVTHILEGSVQRANDAVRVNAQLIEAQTDSHLWAESYDRDIKNIFSVESELAQNVADSLRARLLPAETERVARVPTKNPEAYDLFLKAQYFANQIYSANAKDLVEAARRASDFYESAVRADPNFALAYARLSYLKARVYWYNIDPSAEAIEVSRRTAERALALEPDLAEAHLAMGYFHYYGQRNYDAALAEFAKVRTSLPNSTEVLTAIAFIRRRQGRMEEAIPDLERAAALDPRDVQLHRETGSTFVYLRRYAEATAAFERALALVPEDYEAQVYRVSTAQMSGDLDSARKALAAVPPDVDPEGSISLARWQLAMAMRQPEAALALLEHAPAWLLNNWPSAREPVTLFRAQSLMQKGETARAHDAFLEAQKALETLLNNPRERADAESALGLVYAGLAEKEKALEFGWRATQDLPVSRDMMVGGFYLTQLAMIEAQVGEKQSALDHIEQLLGIPAGHAISRASLRLDPVWDPVRSEPRFQKLSEGRP